MLAYFPTDSSGTNIDTTETGLSGTISFWEYTVRSLINQNLQLATDATRYHGYKNSAARPFIQYSVVDNQQQFFHSKIPKGHILNTTTGAARPNYGQILTNVNICNYVDNKGVKEVWMYGYHSATIVPSESRMSSNYGDVANDNTDPESATEIQYRMPICKNSYVLYNYNYARGVETELHNRIHQVENEIPFTEGYWPPTDQNRPLSLFWGNFALWQKQQNGCGNAHFTPNAKLNTGTVDSLGRQNSVGSGDEYVYDLIVPTQSNCENWNPDSSKSIYNSVTAATWHNNFPNLSYENAFYIWWLQNIPGLNNGISYNGQSMRNWWEAMYDFNGFIDKGRTLFDKPAITCTQ